MDAKEAASCLRVLLERGGSDGFSQEEMEALSTAIKILDMDILNAPILELLGAQYELGYEAGRKREAARKIVSMLGRDAECQ